MSTKTRSNTFLLRCHSPTPPEGIEAEKPYCKVCLHELPCECPPIRTYTLTDYLGETPHMVPCHPKCGKQTWFKSEDAMPFFAAPSHPAPSEAGLLACPFCGFEAIGGTTHAACNNANCQMSIRPMTRENWNRRPAAQPTPKGTVEVLREVRDAILGLCKCVPPAEDHAKFTPLQEAYMDAMPALNKLTAALARLESEEE
jgi:hypothetical protein